MQENKHGCFISEHSVQCHKTEILITAILQNKIITTDFQFVDTSFCRIFHCKLSKLHSRSSVAHSDHTILNRCYQYMFINRIQVSILVKLVIRYRMTLEVTWKSHLHLGKLLINSFRCAPPHPWNRLHFVKSYTPIGQIYTKKYKFWQL